MKKMLVLIAVTIFDTAFGYLFFSYFAYGNFQFRWQVLLWAFVVSLIVTLVFSRLKDMTKRTSS